MTTSHTTPRKAKRRKAMTDRVRLIAALKRFGLTIKMVQFDHNPPLALREWDEEANDTIPPANDPEFIFMLLIEEHDRKTNGTNATTYGSDKHAIAKAVRLENERHGKPKTKAKAHKHDWPSRKLQSRNTFQDRKHKVNGEWEKRQ